LFVGPALDEPYASSFGEDTAVLAPADWTCLAAIGVNGGNGFVVAPKEHRLVPSVPAPDRGAMVSVVNDRLMHGSMGYDVACEVFADDEVLVTALHSEYPEEHCGVPKGRKVRRVGARVAVFADADGTHGAAVIDYRKWGRITVMTCRPGSGLGPAACEDIVADYVARNAK
jgi:hypothetical protein